MNLFFNQVPCVRLNKIFILFFYLIIASIFIACSNGEADSQVSPEPDTKAITAYSLNGVSGVIIGESIVVTLPFDAPIASLVATFTTTGSSVSVDSVTQMSGVTPNNFTSPVVYTVTAANGSKQDYIVTVNKSGKVTLYSFKGGADGANPDAGLIQAADGNLYGTTRAGGVDGGNGTVFKITTSGTETPLYSFKGGSDGSNPASGLIQGNDGNLYGTTVFGGVDAKGAVFKITASGTKTMLYSFTGTAADGANPYAGLVQGAGGDLYGTTRSGGSAGKGTVFKVNASGAVTSLYSFKGGSDGANPYAGLIQGSDGNLYGTTFYGGGGGNGAVFKVTTSGAETPLYSFKGGLDGANPYAGLIQGSDGDLYGTTVFGGGSGNGTVFKVTTSGAETPLYSFKGGLDGANPYAGLIQGSDGNLYGTTRSGGSSNNGTVFKINLSGAETQLYSFTGVATDGANPYAGLIQGSDGNLYGTTRSGGANGVGAVIKISTSGAAVWR